MSCDTIGIASCSEEEFDRTLENVTMKDLVLIISKLQTAMKLEQDHFSTLHTRLAQLPDQSGPEYEAISRDLVKSQDRIGLLMRRNMKCFNAQTETEKSSKSVIKPNSYPPETKPAKKKPTVSFSRTVQSSSARDAEPDKSEASNNQDSDNSKNPWAGILKKKTPYSNIVYASSSDSAETGPVELEKPNKYVTNNNESPPASPMRSSSLQESHRSTVSSKKSNEKFGPKYDAPSRMVSVSVKKDEAASPSADSYSSSVASSVCTIQVPSKSVVVSGEPLESPCRQDGKVIEYSDSSENGNRRDEMVLKKSEELPQDLQQSKDWSEIAQPTCNISQNGDSSPDVLVPPRKKLVSCGKADKPQSLTSPGPAGSTGRQSNGSNGNLASPSISSTSSVVTSQGKMVSVIPRKKSSPTEEELLSSSANGSNACSASVDLTQNANTKFYIDVEESLPRLTNQASQIEVESMMRCQGEMEYSVGSVTVPAKSRAAKMASIKRLESKDKQDKVESKEKAESQEKIESKVEIESQVATERRDSKPEENHQIGKLQKTESVETKSSIESSEFVPIVEPVTDEPFIVTEFGDGMEGEELVKEKTTLLHWDPIKLLEELYDIKPVEDHVEDTSHKYITMGGYMEKLPMNKKKATMLKTWKKRYFRAKEGNLFYYDGNHSDKPTGFIQLMGGTVEDNENKMIGIDDGRGHYMLLKCPTEREHQDWMAALQSQVMGSPQSLYVKPAFNPKPHFRKKVIIVDIGGASVRGGVLGIDPSLPQVFFPAVVAVNKTTGEKVYGFDAYKPEIRSQSKLVYPLRQSAHVDKVNIDKEILPGFLRKVFNELKRNPSMYHVILSTSYTLNTKTICNLMDSLLEDFQAKAVAMMYQPILALYSYSATSGIVVDIGERCDVVPVIDGYLMSGGMSRQPYGGVAITESLNQNLAEHKFRFHTEVERLLVRLAQERSCYVSQDFNADSNRFYTERETFVDQIDLEKYELPDDTFTELSCDSGRFRGPEGLFDTEIFGQDTPFLHKVVHRAIQNCPMDSRREMCRSIYLSGGTTMIPGFAERLKTLLETLVPKSCVVEVHASPHRYHASFIGACVQASLEGFELSCITQKEWKKDQQSCLRRMQAF